MHAPLSYRAAIQEDVAVEHTLFRDIETRSTVSLKTAGAHRYATDPTTDAWLVAYAVDNGPVQLWLPGQPVPPEYFEAAANPAWGAAAHNDSFESAIEQYVLAPRYGFPLVPLERRRCTMAQSLASIAAN